MPRALVIVGGLALSLVAYRAGGPALAGICYNYVCDMPCPASNSCESGCDYCVDTSSCHVCLPSWCACSECSLDCTTLCLPRDLDGDGDEDLADFAVFQNCFGPDTGSPFGPCATADSRDDGSIHLSDFCLFLLGLVGPS